MTRIVNLDTASSDGTVNLIRSFCQVHGWEFFTYDTPPGIGLARFLGNESARGDLYFSLDSDVIIPPGYVQELVAELERDQGLVYASGYMVFGDPGGPLATFYQWKRHHRSPQPTLGATVIRKSLARFDLIQDLHFGEDSAMEAHLILTGGRWAIRHDLVVYNPRPLLEDLRHQTQWGGGAKELGRSWLVELGRWPVKSLEALVIAWESQDWRVAWFIPLRELAHVWGFIKGERGSRRMTLADEIRVINRRQSPHPEPHGQNNKP